MPKINFIIETLNFKESYNLRPRILPDNGIGGEILITILIFILDYFLEKLITTFFKKNPKLYFWDLLSPF